MLIICVASAVPAHAAEPLAVDVTNASEPVLCAEKDNVTINLASRDVRRLRIEAVHPAYIGSLQRDSFEADWTGCSAAGDPAPGPAQPPRRTTLYEDIELWVVGLTFPSFWRPATARRRQSRLKMRYSILAVFSFSGRPLSTAARVRGEVTSVGTYDISENARTVLDMINAAHRPEDLKAPPTNRQRLPQMRRQSLIFTGFSVPSWSCLLLNRVSPGNLAGGEHECLLASA
jgi:hypothetical protein